MDRKAVVNIVVSLAVLALAAGGTWLLTRLRKQPPTRPPTRRLPKVRAARMKPIADYRVCITGYGSVRPKVQVPVVPQVSGEVKYVAANFRSGKSVAKDQVLFRIDKTDYEQSRDGAQRRIELLDANLKRLTQEEANLAESEKLARRRVGLAEDQLRKVRTLHERGAATSNDIDVAQDALLARREQLQQIVNQRALIAPQRRQIEAEKKVRRVELAQAETAIRRATFASPCAGRVLTSDVEVGTRVVAGKAYGEVYATAIMEVPVPISASDLRWVDRRLLQPDEEGKTPAEKHKLIPADVQWFETNGGDRAHWSGYVGRAEAGLEAETRTAKLVVYVENPPADSGRAMLDRNMFCKVVIHGRRVAGALILPRRAILPEGAVYVVVDGRLYRREVIVQRFTDEQAMIFPRAGANPHSSTQPAGKAGAKPPAAEVDTQPARGLADGDLVCTSYVGRFTRGMQVEVILAEPAATQPSPTPCEDGPSSRRIDRPATAPERARPPAGTVPSAREPQP